MLFGAYRGSLNFFPGMKTPHLQFLKTELMVYLGYLVKGWIGIYLFGALFRPLRVKNKSKGEKRENRNVTLWCSGQGQQPLWQQGTELRPRVPCLARSNIFRIIFFPKTVNINHLNILVPIKTRATAGLTQVFKLAMHHQPAMVQRRTLDFTKSHPS